MPKLQPSQHGPFTGGVNAAAGSDANPRGTVPRASNFLGIKRAALTTCDGSSILAWNNGVIQAHDGRFMALEVFQPSGVPPYYLALKQISTIPIGAPFNVTIGAGPLPPSAIPVVSSISPTSGPVGATVTITGKNFGLTQGTSTVTLEGLPLTVVSWSNTSITATIPPGAVSGDVIVTVVSSSGSNSSNPIAFIVLGTPTIIAIVPSAGPVSTAVTILGSNFGSVQSTSRVTFNGVTAVPTNWSDGSITVNVPAGSTTGFVVVTVAGVASNGVTFTVTSAPPHIASIVPTTGPIFALVTITGTGFGTTGTVMFGSLTASNIASYTDTSIVAQVPTGTVSSNVTVTVAGQQSNGVLFTVAPNPVISSLNPSSGPIGSQVDIVGTNFGSAIGIVTASGVVFGGTSIHITNPISWSDTSISVAVPAGATTGPVAVYVSGVSSNTLVFTVTGAPPGPQISSLTPTTGPVGTTVQVAGSSFGSVQSNSTITLSGMPMPVVSWTDTLITITIASGAMTGNMIVTVNHVASNGVLFTVGTSTGVTIALASISGKVTVPVPSPHSGKPGISLTLQTPWSPTVPLAIGDVVTISGTGGPSPLGYDGSFTVAGIDPGPDDYGMTLLAGSNTNTLVVTNQGQVQLP